MRSRVVLAALMLAGCFSEPATTDTSSSETEDPSTSGSTPGTSSSSATMTGPATTTTESTSSGSSAESGNSTTETATAASTEPGTTEGPTTGSSTQGGTTTGGLGQCIPPLPVSAPCPMPGMQLPSNPFRCGAPLPPEGGPNMYGGGGIASTCLGSRPDLSWTFIAPNDGLWLLSTFEQDLEMPHALLAVYDATGTGELGCDQRLGVAAPAELPDFYDSAAVLVELRANQQVVVVIEPFSDGDLGAPAELTATLAATCDPGDCCDGLDTPTCSAEYISDCICEIDPVCCDEAWDQNCVELATAACAAPCI